MRLKYIIDRSSQFAIFSESITHSEMKSRDFDQIVGAGFCTIAPGYDPQTKNEIVNVHCFGKSISLNIESREEDEKIINHKINNSY